MTSFSFNIEQTQGGTMLLRMRHGSSNDATDAERRLHDRLWQGVIALGEREKIGLVIEPQFPLPPPTTH